VEIAENLPKSRWKRLPRPPKYEVRTEPRARPENVKEQIVRDRAFENIRLKSEQVAEFDYRPTLCEKSYRIAVVRKNLSVEKGEQVLFDDVRYFFYITNDRERTTAEVVLKANGRCHQENLIEQLKNGVRALQAPVDNLVSPGAPGGVHGDGLAGVDAEGVVRVASSGDRPLGHEVQVRETDRSTNGVQDVSERLHAGAVPDRSRRPTHRVPSAGLEPVAARVPAWRRCPASPDAMLSPKS